MNIMTPQTKKRIRNSSCSYSVQFAAIIQPCAWDASLKLIMHRGKSVSIKHLIGFDQRGVSDADGGGVLVPQAMLGFSPAISSKAPPRTMSLHGIQQRSRGLPFRLADWI